MSIGQKVRSVLRMKGYRLFERPYELNIVGIRSHHTKANSFDDELHVFFTTGPNKWEHYIFKVTTDPGTYWLKNPMMPQGSAILKEGQYLNVYTIGLHRGKYSALVQGLGKVTVIRDYNRDAVLDFANGREETGWFGINIHRAAKNGTTSYVEKHSAGCQVFEDVKDFDLFMQLAERHRKLYGNKFTYTLVDYRAMKRSTRRLTVVGIGVAVTLLAAFFPQVKYLLAQILKDDENETDNSD